MKAISEGWARESRLSGSPESESCSGWSDRWYRTSKERNGRSNRTCLAAGTEAVDCSDPGHNQAESTGREPGSRCAGTYSGGSPRYWERCIQNHIARITLSRASWAIGGSL